MATKDADTSGGHIQPLPLDAFPIDTSGGNLHPLPRDAFPIGDSYVEQYKAAAKSLKANEYLANLPAFMVSNETVDKLRGIQATYKCRQQHRLDLGYNFLLVTVWDHDRLWGEFNFGLWHGTLCIDDVPSPIDLQAKWPFNWRGARTDDPGVFYKGTGSILFSQGMKDEVECSEVCGEFAGFKDVGIENDICSFDGAGSTDVALDLTDMLHGWNCLRGNEDALEEPRQSVVWEPRATRIGQIYRTAEDLDDD